MMQAFDLFKPESLTEALDLLADKVDQSTALSGGTDLLPQMKVGSISPRGLVSLKRIGELKKVQFSKKTGLRLGATTTLREIVRSSTIQEHYPCLTHTAAHMASAQVRSLATVGGNLCSASPSADLAPPLLALEASLRLIGAAGERVVPLEEFFLGPGMTALSAGELLAEILIPPPEGRTIYIKHTLRRRMDIATVGVAVNLCRENGQTTKARLALGAVSPTPIRAHHAEETLLGELDPDRVERASELAAEASMPIGDVRGSAWYRRKMVLVLVRRAVMHLIAPQT